MSNAPNEEMPMKKNEFLEQYVFHGLTNLNDGFDTASIKYFSQSDFEIVLQKVEQFNLGIHGIEPWLNGKFYDALTCDDFNRDPNDPNWYKAAFAEFKRQNQHLLYTATYEIPTELLEKY